MYSHYSSYKWIGSASAPEDTCRFLSHKITLCRPPAAEGSRIHLTRACMFTWPWPSSFYHLENLVHIVDCHMCLMDKTHIHKAKGHYNIDTLHRCLFSWTASSLKSGFLSFSLKKKKIFFFWPVPWSIRDPTLATRDRTCTPCSGSERLNHWTAREVLCHPHVLEKWLVH